MALDRSIELPLEDELWNERQFRLHEGFGVGEPRNSPMDKRTHEIQPVRCQPPMLEITFVLEREAGLIIFGTLGALTNLVRGDALSLTEADKFLAIMKRSGYRCPVNSLSELDMG